jgi:hypothetical protein
VTVLSSSPQLLLGLAVIVPGGLIFASLLSFGREDDDFWAGVERDQDLP